MLLEPIVLTGFQTGARQTTPPFKPQGTVFLTCESYIGSRSAVFSRLG